MTPPAAGEAGPSARVSLCAAAWPKAVAPYPTLAVPRSPSCEDRWQTAKRVRQPLLRHPWCGRHLEYDPDSMVFWVVPHFEIRAASQISAVMDQSHRIWQSNGSAANVARFVEPPARAGSIATGPLGLFWLFLQPINSQCSNCQIRDIRIYTEFVTLRLGILGEAPRRSFQSRRRHLFHLFYQVHIRLGSCHSPPRCFRHLYLNISHPARPIAQRNPSALSQAPMRREHCGNFSVAYIATSAESLQLAGVTSAPKPS